MLLRGENAMRKFISGLLIVVLVLCLSACGKKEAVMSEEDLLNEAISVDMITLQNAIYNNPITAKEAYCDVPIKVTGDVIQIKEDYVVLCDSQVCLDAYLSRDDLSVINNGSTISVVGIITEIREEEQMLGGTSFTFLHYVMSEGYLTQE